MTTVTDLLANLLAGTRLGLFLPVRRQAFRCKPDQAVLLLILSVALMILYQWATTGPNRTFSVDGLNYLGAYYLTFVLTVFLIARIQRRPWSLPALMVLLLSTVLVAIGILSLSQVLGSTISQGSMAWIWSLLWFGFGFLWVVAIAFRAIRLVHTASKLRATGLSVLYCVSAMAFTAILPADPVFYGENGDREGMSVLDYVADPASTETERSAAEIRAEHRHLDVEAIYYDQHRLMNAAVSGLAPQRPRITDLYQIGFGSYAYQDVFWREVLSIQDLFDDRFDTQARSIALVNSTDWVDQYPLANRPNLRTALNAVGRVMDREEDIAFLYLTSHGSSDHRLSVDFWPLRLNDLSATDLRELLDESGIKWRVIVVSACYSGGFIDALKDDNSLIITAARHDRTSFGCSDDRDFTYFSEAYFDRSLRSELSFVQAFHHATALVREWEVDQDIPQSLPQIHVGAAIKPKLEELERRLKKLGQTADRNAPQ